MGIVLGLWSLVLLLDLKEIWRVGVVRKGLESVWVFVGRFSIRILGLGFC